MARTPFKPVDLHYAGKSYKVEPTDVWGLIGSITNVIGSTYLAMRLIEGNPDDYKVCEAYASALRYAGVSGVTGLDVFMEKEGFQSIIDMATEMFHIVNIASPPKEIASDGEKKSQETTIPTTET